MFAHGMLSMGLTGTMLTDYVGDGALKKYGVSLLIKYGQESTYWERTIIEIREEDGSKVIDLAIETTNQDNAVVT